MSEFVRQADPQITWRGFQDIVATLRNRKILQGDTTLYITPKLLHIKLWIDWWDTYGEGFSVEDITTLPPSLVTWFLEMFEYARGSPAALRTASHLLGPDGLFQKNPELLSKGVGPRFFRFLAKADPEGALRCLNNTIGTWDREQLLQFESGRREAVWALQDIARWGHLFRDAAELLLALGEAENETWANNASGVFVDLFVISEHRVFNQTEASPQERFSVIKRALESDSAERRALALRACDRALQRVTVGTVRDSTQIVGPQPEIWVPSTYKELLDAYREVWQYLFSKLDTLSEDDKLKVVEILLRNARSLAWLGNLSSMIINTITELSQKTYIDKEEVLKVVTQVLHYDGPNLPEEVREKWMDLKNSLIGKDFSSLLERYVRMDIFEDQFDEDGNLVDQTQEPIRNLAQQAIENESLLHSELDWLVTTKAQKGYQFGYELGKLDRSSSLLPEITEAQKNADQNSSLYFFGGYLRAVFEQAPQEWESLMDTFVQDEKSKNWVPELTWRLGKLSDKSAVRVLDLMEEGITDLGHFRMFIYGGILQDLTEDIFIRWMEFIISQSDTYASYIALALFSHYYLAGNSQQKPPKNLMLKVLTNPELFKKSDIARKDQMVSYYWAKIGKTFVRLYPERSLDLGDVILSNLGTSGTILEGFDTDPYSVLSEILQRFPEETWKRIAEHLIPPRDRCAFFLEKWLRGEDHWKKEEAGALSLVPPRIIWDWASEDIENRAWYLASFVPKLLVCEEDQVCWAREVLVRYGEREDVRRNLAANFSTEGWWGPESLYLAEKRDQLLTFKENEDNENVRVWIDEYVLQLEQRIEQARIMEERDEFL